MWMVIFYGLECFWGEYLWFLKKEKFKFDYWKSIWDEFVEIMKKVDVIIFNDLVKVDDIKGIRNMS